MRWVLSLIFRFSETTGAQSQLRRQHINVEDGLSQSSVYRISQDSYGFMWFSTGDGLDRYDGKDFIVYKSRFKDAVPGHIRDRNINSPLYEDKLHRLWMTTDAGLSCFDPHNSKFTVVLQKYCTALAIDDSSVWSAEVLAGLYRTNTFTRRTSFYPFTDKWHTDGKKICAVQSGVIAPGGVWMTDNAGLVFFNKHTHTYKRVFLNENLESVNRLHDGRLLLCALNGVYIFDTGSYDTDFIPLGAAAPGGTQWRSFAQDTVSHTVYVGSLSGEICTLDINTRASGILKFQNSNVYCLFVDRSENLWAGTDGNGIYRIDIKQPKFRCYAPDRMTNPGADGLMVKSIYRDDSTGLIWIGSYNRGLITYDPIRREAKPVILSVGSENKLISAIFKDSSRCVVVTVGPNIIWLDPHSRKEIRKITLPFLPNAALGASEIYTIVEWKKDHFLAGTQIGLFMVNAAVKKSVPYHLPWSSEWIYDIQRAGNAFYIGARDNYAKISLGDDSSVHVLDTGFAGIAIRHFYKSRFTPVLWMATEKGLIAYNEISHAATVFDETSGLLNSFVYAILPQNDSLLWISTNRGISNVHVHYDGNGKVSASFSNYTFQDGLQSDEFNTGAYYKDPDGTFFFGGIAGINWFRPEAITPNPYTAFPAISGISVNDRIYAGDTANFVKTLILPFDKNTISLKIRALEYTHPEQNTFAYKLEGLDKEWVYTNSDKIRYSGLPPGAYTFLLKAGNNDDIWNNTPHVLNITILPPYWQTWWFRILISALAIGAVYAFVRYYIKQKVRAQLIEFEKQQALHLERMRISKDVHDDLGAGLSKISLMAEIAQKKTGGNEPLGTDIRHISSVSKELIDNMRDLIWVLNPDNTTLDQLVARLREYCLDYLENVPMSSVLDFPEHVSPVRTSREVQRNIFLTVKEAINNCVKHSGAGAINVTLSIDEKEMRICISDNGNGFNIATLKGSGNGLRNMRQRIEAIGGAYMIRSAEGSNTMVQMAIPLEVLAAEKIPL